MDADDMIFGSVRATVQQPTSPIGAHLRKRYPHNSGLRARVRPPLSALRVPGREQDASTLGTAFDWMVRYTLDPNYRPDDRYLPLVIDPATTAAVQGVLARARTAAVFQHDLGRTAPVESYEELARACWVLALFTNIYHGESYALSPLDDVAPWQHSDTWMLSLASDEAVDELGDLQDVAHENLYPLITPSVDLHFGAEFDGAQHYHAEADIIADGHLIDVKTVGGRGASKRHPLFEQRDFHQIVTYALLDKSNRYGIERVSIYFARYGMVCGWPLREALSEAAGRPVTLPTARKQMCAAAAVVPDYMVDFLAE